MDHSFSPTAHGKGPADSIGFWVKHWLSNFTRSTGRPFSTPLACVSALNSYLESQPVNERTASNPEHTIHYRHVSHVDAKDVIQRPCLLRTVPETRRHHFYAVCPLDNEKLYQRLATCPCSQCLIHDWSNCSRRLFPPPKCVKLKFDNAPRNAVDASAVVQAQQSSLAVVEGPAAAQQEEKLIHQEVLNGNRCWICQSNQFEDFGKDYLVCKARDPSSQRCLRWIHTTDWNGVKHVLPRTRAGALAKTVTCWFCQHCFECRQVLGEEFHHCDECDINFCSQHTACSRCNALWEDAQPMQDAQPTRGTKRKK